MRERTVMENQESVETQGEDWVVEARKQIDNIKRDANREADLNQKVQTHQDVQAYQDYGRPWQEVRQEVYGKHYDLYLKNFAKGNLTEAKRYAQDWDQFIQAHPEVVNLARSELTTWFLENKTPFDQADNLLISREMARGIQMAEATPRPAAEGLPAVGGEGQPPREPPPAPPAGPPVGGEDEPPQEGESRRGEDNDAALDELYSIWGIGDRETLAEAEHLYFRVHPEDAEAYRTAPTEELLSRVSRQVLSTARSLGRRKGRLGLAKTLGEAPRRAALDTEKEEIIMVTTEYGDREVIWPKEDEAKIERMRHILNGVESESYPDGGDTWKYQLTELALVISSLLRSGQKEIMRESDPQRNAELLMVHEPRRILGEIMHKEFIARLYLHQGFLQYDKAGKTETIFQVHSLFFADHLNFFFRDSGSRDKKVMVKRIKIWEAMKYYEQHTNDYLDIRGEYNLKKFRQKVRDEITKDEPTLSEQDIVSSQMLAERLWQITTRRVVKDNLVKQYTNISPSKNDLDKGSVEFRSDAGGGNWAARKIMRFKEYTYTQIDAQRVIPKLLDGVDIGTEDFFKGYPGIIQGFYKKELYFRYKGEGLDEDEARRLAEEGSITITKVITGLEQVKINEKDVWEEEYARDTSDEPVLVDGKKQYLGYYNIEGFKWSLEDLAIEQQQQIEQLLGRRPEHLVDFSLMGTNPMVSWSYRKIFKPDEVIEPFMGKVKAFLRTPSAENLIALADIFIYQTDRQWETKSRLVSNFVDYIRSKEAKNFGYIKPDRMMIDAVINNTARELGLNSEEVEKIAKEKLGKSIIANIGLGLSYFKADRFFFMFIFEIIKGIVQQALNIK